MSKTYKTGAPWHLWLISLFFIFIYANGVYDVRTQHWLLRCKRFWRRNV